MCARQTGDTLSLGSLQNDWLAIQGPPSLPANGYHPTGWQRVEIAFQLQMPWIRGRLPQRWGTSGACAARASSSTARMLPGVPGRSGRREATARSAQPALTPSSPVSVMSVCYLQQFNMKVPEGSSMTAESACKFRELVGARGGQAASSEQQQQKDST